MTKVEFVTVSFKSNKEVSFVVIACIFCFIHISFCKKFTSFVRFLYIDNIYDGFSMLFQFICCDKVRYIKVSPSCILQRYKINNE